MTAATCAERRRDITVKIFKAIMIVAMAVGALSLGACSQHKDAPATTTTSSTYSK
jgi:hypothetical protein